MAKRKSNKSGSVPKVQLDLADETKRSIFVTVLVVIALISFLSLFHLAGQFGEYLLSLMYMLFGVMAFLVPVVILLLVVSMFRDDWRDEQNGSFIARSIFGGFLLSAGIAGLIHLILVNDLSEVFLLARSGGGGGYFGALFAWPVLKWLGYWTGVVLLLAFVLIAVLVMFDISFGHFTKWFASISGNKDADVSDGEDEGVPEEEGEEDVKEIVNSREKAVLPDPEDEFDEEVLEDFDKEGVMPTAKPVTVSRIKDWKLPSLDLLEVRKTAADSGNIEKNAQIIKKTLLDFGVKVDLGEVFRGPTVTQYTLKPATGVRLATIAQYEKDLALALSAPSVRMELPIPGKPLVGIEIPNTVSSIVGLRDIMDKPEFTNHKSRLCVAFGKDVTGKPFYADLADMPHLLVAGATGMGKSVCINSILMSLLYRNSPDQVKILAVDPKRVELTLYNGIPHLLTPVVTDPQKAINALKWTVGEMDRRLRLLEENKVKNITEYNGKAEAKWPYIVVLVDELADLMQTSQSEVESSIVRLAQLARAVGIHLVLATQYPKAEIITGLIKANITARIAFAVASNQNSRVILDEAGAEDLLGRGDLLFVSKDHKTPKRVQGAFVETSEVEKVVKFLKSEVGAVMYDEGITEKPRRDMSAIASGPGTASGNYDEKVEEAITVVRQARKASASLLQRRLGLGYARAARILDELEELGVVGPSEGAKPREVFGPDGSPLSAGKDDDEQF